uniref:MARVEL domain-containing protein n=1 Tax=Heligmosomoides polygyrus TaxID=6339 RepID=A0A183GTC2_HELPZ
LSVKNHFGTLIMTTFAGVLLLLCEVIDWSLAAFSPVYFHSSSLFSRILPFIVGGILCAIIVAALVVIDATTETSSCISAPTDTAVISAYDISVVFATISLVALGVLLAKKLNSSLYKPVLFHFVSTLLLLEIPLVVVISLKYAGQGSAAIQAADATNMLVAIDSALHSAFFIYNHEDYRVKSGALKHGSYGSTMSKL